MRGLSKELTLQELRRIHRASSVAREGSPRPNNVAKNPAATKAQTGDHSTKLAKNSVIKAKGKQKARSRSSRQPRELGCRKFAPANGALVLPDGEVTGPILLTGRPSTSSVAATVSPEVEAYRAAVAAYQLKRIRGGIKRRSASSGSRDPRFSNLCGKLDVASCAKAYSFVEEQQQQLMQQLQQVVKTGRVPTTTEEGRSKKGRKANASERRQAEEQLQRLQSQQQQRERKAAEAALKASLSRAERERIAATGKRPHFVSKKKLREMLREQQKKTTSNRKKIKQEIRQSKKALSKERKRNLVPQRRNRSGDEK